MIKVLSSLVVGPLDEYAPAVAQVSIRLCGLHSWCGRAPCPDVAIGVVEHHLKSSFHHVMGTWWKEYR